MRMRGMQNNEYKIDVIPSALLYPLVEDFSCNPLSEFPFHTE